MEFRKMRRFKQALSEEEITTILTNEKRAVLSMHGDNDYPYAIPINFVYDEGKLYFHWAIEGHKLDAIRNNPKVCFTIMDQGYRDDVTDWAYYVRSVVAFGHAKIIEDDTLRREKLIVFAKKYFPESVDIEDELRRNFHRVLLMEITIDHMTGKLVHEK